MARLVYTETSLMRQKPFVTAARVSGSSTLQIMAREVLPNVLGSLVVYSTTIVGAMIVIGAGFSFLGIGIQPPTADWGIMTADGTPVLDSSPHISLLPGVAIIIVALAFAWIGDGLRLAVDPRKRVS